MKIPEIPDNEPDRIAALCSLEVLDTPPEERFDRITRIAQRHFQVPIALVSLIDSNRQWFKSRQGLDATETPRDISFCGHAILSDEIFYIPNTLEDSRFANNPLVSGDPNIRFYAGAPLHSPEGERIGTLCIIDEQPRQFSNTELSLLRDMADCAEAEFNRTGLLKAAQKMRDQEQRIHALLDTIVDGIIVIDGQGRIQTLNPAAVSLFGYSSEEVEGQNIKMLMPEPYAAEHDGYLHNYLTTGHKKVIGIGREVTGKRKNGTTFPMELAVSEMEVNGERMFTGIVRDITERKRAEIELQTSENRIRALFDTIVDGIVVIDAKGRVQTVNPAAVALFGYSPEELHSQNIKMLMPEPYAAEHDGYLHNYLTTGNKKVIGIGREVTGRRKDGTTFPMELAVSEMEVNGERMFTGIVRDITERKKVEQMKTEFISTVSHELRTPLTSISGALALVLGNVTGELPEKARLMLDMAARNSERLTLLINDILDLEKIEAGRLDFDFRIVDLVDLARRALEDNEGYARKHQVRLVLDNSVKQASVLADEHRLLQVFSNLISNAVKFSPENGVVEVSVVTHGSGFRTAVRDYGAGIPQEFHRQIFQRFAQADSSDSREKGGTGLGLSITKAIVERHDGEVSYETEAGVGTVFHFDIPAWQAVTELDKTVSGIRVLICEDNPDVASVLADMLEPEGLVCDIAASAAGARTLLAKNDYRLMLLDLTLPDADGLIFLQELREAPVTAQLPVIVVSGRAHEGRAAFQGDAVTVVDWIQKPVNQLRLEQALQEALRRVNRPRILHLEDDPDIVQVTQVLLEKMADVIHVENLQEARQLIAEQSIDLVILDLGLPDGSGLELLDELKGHCPVVIFSAQIPNRDITEQVVAALTKSATSNEQLLATIKNSLNMN